MQFIPKEELVTIDLGKPYTIQVEFDRHTNTFRGRYNAESLPTYVVPSQDMEIEFEAAVAEGDLHMDFFGFAIKGKGVINA